MSRPYVSQETVLAPTTGNMAATVHSVPSNIKMMSLAGYDLSWTGTPVGTFTVEVSNSYTQDPNGNAINAGNWTALTLSTAVTATGAAGGAFIDIDAVSASWMRLTYTPSSGTGILTAIFSAKVS